MTGRVNLYEEEFDKLIDDRGNIAMWERAAVCWCVNRESGQPDPMCTTCGGSGYRYMQPKQIIVGVTSLTGQIQLKTLELREPGMAYITPKGDIVMGYRDRLTFPEFTAMMSEVVHWGKDGCKRGVSPKTFREIKSVVLLADDQYEYEEGVDFEVTDDRFHLRWLRPDYVPTLENVHNNMSFLYETSPSYIVVDLLHELRGTRSDRNSAGITYRELPKQYKLQREDFVYHIAEPEGVPEPEPEEIEDDVEGILIK